MLIKVTGNRITYKEYEVEFEFKNSKLADLILKLNINSCELAIFCSLLAYTNLDLQQLIDSTKYSESSVRNAITKMTKQNIISKVENQFILNVLDNE